MSACRDDLILPRDAAPGVRFALLRISAPKSRGRAAKHQAARVDPPDIINLLDAVFGGLQKDEKWPFSAAILRRRFSDLLKAVALPTKKIEGRRPFDLGSLRPGGATFMFLEHEDAEGVRRRGRWVSSKVCDIYIQEVMYTTYTEKLTHDTKNLIQQLASAFPRIFNTAIMFLRTAVPPRTWHRLYQADDAVELGEEWEENGRFASFCPT